MIALVEVFTEAMKANPDLGPLPVHTGWTEITPAKGINLLMRNLPGANRKVDPNTVIYYANQMEQCDWKATGQPILVDANGRLLDAQHRLLAGLISGMTFKSYVVTEIERTRSCSRTSTMRGRVPLRRRCRLPASWLSPIIVRMIKVAEEVKYGVYNPGGATKLARMSPATILRLSRHYPNAQKAARSAASDWAEAVESLVAVRTSLLISACASTIRTASMSPTISSRT